MRKIIVFMVVLLLAVSFSYGEKLAVLKDLGKPNSMFVDQGRIFVNEKATVYIYSLKDFSLIKKFGRQGEGPEEFKVHTTLNKGGVGIAFQGDMLVITSVGRLSYFTRDGVYKKESSPPFCLGKYIPLDEHFAGLGVVQDGGKDYFTLNIYDSTFKDKKEIFRFLGFQAGKHIDPIAVTQRPAIYISNDEIFVNDYVGVIHVFDKNGKEIRTITYDYDKVNVTEEREKKVESFFLADMAFKGRYTRDRANGTIKYPEYFPAIRDYSVVDNKVYVVTFKEEGTNKEIYTFDIKGKFLKKGMYPLGEMNGLQLNAYFISDGTLYQLMENQDTEDWEFHSTKIN